MEEEVERNSGHGFLWFLIGVGCGVVAAIWGPRWAAPYLPSFLGGATGVEGVVLEKVPEPERILVKVSTPDGLVLVTFTQNLEELDLLIGQGDSITLGLDGYETLVENPPVSRVVGSTTAGPTMTAPAPEPETPGTEIEVESENAEETEAVSEAEGDEREDATEDDAELADDVDEVEDEAEETTEAADEAPSVQ